MDMKTSPLSLLKDPTLLKTDALINGQWVKGAKTARFDVLDPATGAKLADVANLGPADAEAAIKAAMDDPAFRQVVGNYGVRTQFRGSQEYTAFARKAFEDEKKIVQNIGLED